MTFTDTTEASQYLTFKLDKESFALDIGQIKEILDFPEITKVPRMPDFLRGVINLRGGLVPVVDLRLKLGMTKTEKTNDTCIIIMDLVIDGEGIILGALADSVQEVIIMDADQILPPPKIGARLDAAFIKGLGKKGDELVIIVDIERIFSSYDASMLQVAQQQGNTVNKEDKDPYEDVEG